MKLTKSQVREIRALKRMKEEDIDLTDIPEMRNPAQVVVGKFYRPIKKSLTIRIDADVLAWVRSQGKGYQTRINRLLREAMETANKRFLSVSQRPFAETREYKSSLKRKS